MGLFLLMRLRLNASRSVIAGIASVTISCTPASPTATGVKATLFGPNRIACTPANATASGVTAFMNASQFTISGTSILKKGAPFTPMGFNYGKNQLYGAADPAEDVTMGANAVRILMRARTGAGSTPDGEGIGQPGDWLPSYLTGVSDPVVNAAYAAGLMVNLAFESNCDINCFQGEPLCDFGGLPNQNVFNNATVKGLYLNRVAYATQRYLGKVAFYEPGSEPAPQGQGGVTVAQVLDFQEEVMDLILSINPRALFCIGGQGYANGQVANAYRASWATKYPNKIVVICNFLGGALSTNFDTKRANLIAGRTAYNVPVLTDQLGIESVDDPTESITANGFEKCRIGGIGVYYWEKVTLGESAFGCWYDPGATGSRILKPTRKAVVEAGFKAVTATAGTPADAIATGVAATIRGAKIISFAPANASAAGVSASISGGSQFETTFDSLFTSWTPITDSTFRSRPSQAKPTSKASSNSSPSYTDQRYGVPVFKVTDPSDSPDSVYYMVHEYSRKKALNCNNTLFYTLNQNGFHWLYDANTRARLNGGRTASPGLGALGVGASIRPGSNAEFIWHPTDPHRYWNTDDSGGMAVYETYIGPIPGTSTPTRSTHINWTPIIASLGSSWSAAARLGWQAEGRPSDDGDVWGMEVMRSNFTTIGFIGYRKSTNTVLWSILTGNKPNHSSTAPDGSGIVIGWNNFSNRTLAQCASSTIDNTDGVRYYKFSDGSFVQAHYTAEHADLGWNALGNPTYVSGSYSGVRLPQVGDGYVFALDLVTGVYSDLFRLYNGGKYAFHVSGCTSKRVGWFLVGTYGTPAASSWDDDTLFMIEAKANPKHLMLVHSQSFQSYVDVNDGAYWSEPHGTINADGTRFFWHADFNVGAPGSISSYMGVLPSDWTSRV
jgi:hypothetical protein